MAYIFRSLTRTSRRSVFSKNVGTMNKKIMRFFYDLNNMDSSKNEVLTDKGLRSMVVEEILEGYQGQLLHFTETKGKGEPLITRRLHIYGRSGIIIQSNDPDENAILAVLRQHKQYFHKYTSDHNKKPKEGDKSYSWNPFEDGMAMFLGIFNEGLKGEVRFATSKAYYRIDIDLLAYFETNKILPVHGASTMPRSLFRYITKDKKDRPTTKKLVPAFTVEGTVKPFVIEKGEVYTSFDQVDWWALVMESEPTAKPLYINIPKAELAANEKDEHLPFEGTCAMGNATFFIPLVKDPFYCFSSGEFFASSSTYPQESCWTCVQAGMHTFKPK